MPKIELEIGENLFLRIEFVDYVPMKAGRYCDIPEKCYQDEPSEVNFDDDDVKLVVVRRRYDPSIMSEPDVSKWKYKDIETVLPAPKGFADMYMDQICDEADRLFTEGIW